ncbi:multiple sugar transport system substrate-binding protein [Kribbella sp. VKM Ac-2527]|uniref:Multiple sugar transport system substrate-binding protein n=1 Tax=Kribbella caucasensis TaxID=2512215 RepID=A0A4R6KGC5_9ACTN|nr:sugar ABC transporter substrate-binding protein [Kribbella sp. VKM Ac-2527]TDO49920.1 multiple sugar transport system substrate-binding protein [Kribbella sp. VKM Ac-2527]
MSRKTVLAAIAGGVITAFVLTGCGRAATSGGAVEAGAPVDNGPATGTVDVWAMGTEGEKLPELVAKFEKENPDADVKVTAVPWQDYAKKIETAVASGSTPDATLVGSSDLASFVAGGGLEPVPAGLVDVDSFYPGARSSTEIDGATYAVPWYVETRVLFYRKDLAQAAGAKAPTTWDEFTPFAKALQAQGAKWGFSVATGAPYTWQGVLPYLWQAGAELTDAERSKFTFDSKQGLEGLTRYQSLFTDGIASPNGPVNLGEVEPKFVSGEVGSFISGPWEIGLLNQAGGKKFLANVGVAKIPAGPHANTSYIGGGHFSVFKDAKNRDGAWKLIRWLSKPKTQTDWFTISGDLPAAQSAWESDVLSADPNLAVFREQLKNAQNAPAVTTWTQVGALVDSEAEKVAKRVSTPQEALAAIQAGAAKIGTGN